MPTSIAGMADPADLPEKLILGAFMYGGNFVVYGFVGMVIGIFIRLRMKNSK
jgi:hypothetical protein